MPICITCSTPVKELYTVYSKADDRTLGKGVRLTQCPNCKRFADKYVEHDFVVLFIDLVLIKPQVYRHLLFNRLGRSDDKFDPSILRLGTLLILFDVYITWARIEKSNAASRQGADGVDARLLNEMPILAQYLFFLTMNVLATFAQHGVIRALVKLLLKPSSSSPTHQEQQPGGHEGAQEAATPTVSSNPSAPSPSDAFPRTRPPTRASPSAISTALLVSSCTKLFPILLVIWPTTPSTNTNTSSSSSDSFGFAFRATNYVGWAVLLNNIEALLILLNCGYVVATTLAISGFLARWMVEGWFLSFVGLARDTGPVGDMLVAWRFIRGWVGGGG